MSIVAITQSLTALADALGTKCLEVDCSSEFFHALINEESIKKTYTYFIHPSSAIPYKIAMIGERVSFSVSEYPIVRYLEYANVRYIESKTLDGELHVLAFNVKGERK